MEQSRGVMVTRSQQIRRRRPVPVRRLSSTPVPAAPPFSSRLLWETNRGTVTPVRSISSPRHAQEVCLCDLVLEDDKDRGLHAVIVCGPTGRVVAQVRGDASGHRSGPHGSAFPLQEEGPCPFASAQDAVGIGMNGAQPVAVPEVAGRSAGRVELDDLPGA